MVRRQLATLLVATAICLALVCAVNLGVASSQEQRKVQPAPDEKTRQHEDAGVARATDDAQKRFAMIEKMVAEYDLTPHPPLPIPDNPPPHEGAMISLQHIVEPPDLVLVEVLEALPGRPISGERLVRPDGKIDIGFYGEVYVRGLTLEQVKVAIIKHLRKFLNDEALGLVEMLADEDEMGRPATERPKVPKRPEGGRNPFEPDDKIKPRPSSNRARATSRPPKTRPASSRPRGSRIPVRLIDSTKASPEYRSQEPAVSPSDPIKIPIGDQGKVTITIELKGHEAGAVAAPEVEGVDNDARMVIQPADSAHVFVDITSYNSKNYYILGDVLVTGKLPCTGNETVLDALQFAGGLTSSAEPKDIRLVRPARGGKPARVYKVDLAAIQNGGDVTTNYQIFPNDRLIVGRNEIVKKTVEIDRLNAPIQSVVASLLQEAYMLRALQFATTDNREELLKELVDFWTNELSRPGGTKFDEQTLRDALLRKMKLTPAPLTPTPAPK